MSLSNWSDKDADYFRKACGLSEGSRNRLIGRTRDFTLTGSTLFAAACTPAAVPASSGTDRDQGAYTLRPGTVVTDLYWSDGDSGRANGVKFRLADIDAPETSGVGARGGAKCEAERVLGFAAKAFVVKTTRTGRAGDAMVVVTDLANVDRYDRQVLSLSVDGEPLSALGMEAGHSVRGPTGKAGR